MRDFHEKQPGLILDHADLRILNILQQKADTDLKDIATTICKSMSSTHKRIRRMRDKGVIQRYVVVLDRRLVGRPTLVVTLVQLKQHGIGVLREFAGAMADFPEVQFCLHLSGEYDFLLHVTLTDCQEYEEFLEFKLLAHPMVNKVQSSFVLKEFKSMAALPLVS